MHEIESQKNISIKQPRNNSSEREIRDDSSDAVVSGLLHINKLVERFGKEKRWVNYRLKIIEERTTKIPYSPITKRKASSIKEDDWGTYSEAVAIDKEHVGIIFKSDKKLIGIDLDHVIEDGKQIPEYVMEFFIEANTYCELSPSKTGLHFYLELTEPLELIANRSGCVEIYNSGRYFTVTEDIYKEEKEIRLIDTKEAIRLLKILGYPWNKDNETLVKGEITMDDNKVLEYMFGAKNGKKIKTLYDGDKTSYKDDDSAADMALCSHLAFWTNKNFEQIERIWLASPLGDREKTQGRSDYRKRTINNAIKNCTETYETQGENDGINYGFLRKNKKNTLCLENIAKVLRLNSLFAGRFRWDNFKNQIEINENDKWVQFEDKHIVNVQRVISTQFTDFQTIRKDMAYDAVFLVAHENAIDSAIDYLKGLKWDGTPRLDTWLCSVYGVPNDKYHRAVGSNWLKGLVKRIVFPGCKFDYVLVLEGEQGTKKSTSLSILGGEWHMETTMGTDTKDFFMQFSSKAIIEFSEGETLSRTEVKRMKAIITTQNDKFRAPYDRVSRDHPRRCVFAMTTNSTEYLKDETGNRRWLPVATVFPEANIEWIKTNRDQLYAETYYRVITKNETTWDFPKEETKAQQDARRISDPNSELVIDWYFNALNETDRNAGITILQVHINAFGNHFSKKMQKYEEMSIANILKDVLKLEKKQNMLNGIRATRWYPRGLKESDYETPKSIFEKDIAFNEF